MLSITFFLSFSSSSPLFLLLFLPLIPPPPITPPFSPQVLLESALKHWSRVKRYVAQDGSG